MTKKKVANHTDYILNLKKFGLTNEESQVYITLLKSGERGNTVNYLKNLLNIGRTTIYAILDRLIDKKWVKKGSSSNTRNRAQLYVATSPIKILNDIIYQKEQTLNELKEINFNIGDNLERIYRSSIKFTIDQIHASCRKYLRPLINKKWKILSEVLEISETLNMKTFDYQLEGKNDFHNECGLIICEYDHNIENDADLARYMFNLLKKKGEQEIRKHEPPGFEDVKYEEINISGFIGANTYMKFKKGSEIAAFVGSDWFLAGKLVVIPKINKIFMMWGGEKNFKKLVEVILKEEKIEIGSNS
ncbi:MAG: helix-turn-helix domain-containing protein [Candidatus Helarchaeota archaeon]